jgi:hypothetical protein
MYEVAPFGERRADCRSAVSAANTIAAASQSQVSPDDFYALYSALMNYLPCHKDSEEEVDLDAVKKIKDMDNGGPR